MTENNDQSGARVDRESYTCLDHPDAGIKEDVYGSQVIISCAECGESLDSFRDDEVDWS